MSEPSNKTEQKLQQLETELEQLHLLFHERVANIEQQLISLRQNASSEIQQNTNDSENHFSLEDDSTATINDLDRTDEFAPSLMSESLERRVLSVGASTSELSNTKQSTTEEINVKQPKPENFIDDAVFDDGFLEDDGIDLSSMPEAQPQTQPKSAPSKSAHSQSKSVQSGSGQTLNENLAPKSDVKRSSEKVSEQEEKLKDHVYDQVQPQTHEQKVSQKESSSPQQNVTSKSRRQDVKNKTPFDLSKWLLESLGPLGMVLNKGLSVYRHYQQQDKAASFLLGVTGAIAVIAGFGYLLQYSFSNWMPLEAKFGLGYLASFGVVYLGFFLHKKKTDMSDFASSILAIGLVFLYLCTYFMGAYFGLVSAFTSLIVLLLVTGLAYSLALIYETRVVAVITLVGGVLSPIVLGQLQLIDTVFLTYLWGLALANCVLARKIKWPALAQLTFAICIGLLSYKGIVGSTSVAMSFLLTQAFYSLFLVNWLFDGARLKTELSKIDLSILTANLFYCLAIFLTVDAEAWLQSTALLLNAAILMAIYRMWRVKGSDLSALFALMVSLFIASAVFVLVPFDVSALLWGVEGLVLVYIGYRYNQPIVRIEGYVLYFIAIANLFGISLDQFYLMIDIHWTMDSVAMLSLGGLLFAGYRLMEHGQQRNRPFEFSLFYGLKESFTLWGAISLIILFNGFNTQQFFMLLIVPILWCLFRGIRHQLLLSILLSTILLFASILFVLTEFVQSNSILIVQQQWTTWIILAEVIVFVFTLPILLKRYYPTCALLLWSNFMRSALFVWVPALFLIRILDVFSISRELIEGQFDYAIYYETWLVGFLLITALWVLTQQKKRVGHDKGEQSYACLSYFVETEQRGSRLIQGVSRNTQQWMQKISREKRRHAIEFPQFLHPFKEVFLSWCSFTFLLTVFLFLTAHWQPLAILSFVTLLFLSLKYDFKWTEKIAWLHLLLLVWYILDSGIQLGTLRFTQQHWITQLSWVLLFVSAWGAQWLYEKRQKTDGFFQFSNKTRIAVYLLIPILLLPTVARRWTEFLPLALWCSVVIAWCLHRWVAISILKKETIVLFFIAMLTTALFLFDVFVVSSTVAKMLAIVLGAIVTSFLIWQEKAMVYSNWKQSDYRTVFSMFVLFSNLCLFAIAFLITGSILFSISVVGFVFLLLVSSHYQIGFVRRLLPMMFSLSIVIIALNSVLLWTGSSSVISQMTVFFSAFAASWIVFSPNRRIALFIPKAFQLNLQHWVYHGFILSLYAGFIKTWFGDVLSVWLSIAFVIHAILVLFLTLNSRYQHLIKISVLLYGLTAAKVLMIDMQNTIIVYKIIALMGIGSLLLLAAYLFQNMKNKIKNQPIHPQSESESDF